MVIRFEQHDDSITMYCDARAIASGSPDEWRLALAAVRERSDEKFKRLMIESRRRITRIWNPDINREFTHSRGVELTASMGSHFENALTYALDHYRILRAEVEDR